MRIKQRISNPFGCGATTIFSYSTNCSFKKLMNAPLTFILTDSQIKMNLFSPERYICLSVLKQSTNFQTQQLLLVFLNPAKRSFFPHIDDTVVMRRLVLEYTGTKYEDKMVVCGPPPTFDRSSWTDQKFSLGLDFPNLPYYTDEEVKRLENFTRDWKL